MRYNEFYKNIGFKNEIVRLEKQVNLFSKKEMKTLKLMGIKDGSKILDLGCGPGFYTEKLLNEFSKSKIVALDSDKYLIEFAKKMLEEKYKKRIDFITQDIEKNNIPNDTFDYVISRLVFQHLDNPLNVAKEIYRILKPGGKVIIIDIDNDLWGTTYPESKLVKILNTNLSSVQKSMGGNRKIGRLLVSVLKNVGFKDLGMEAVVNHSEIIGKEVFKHEIPEEIRHIPEMSNFINEYNKFFDLSFSSIMMLLFFVGGTK